MIRNLFFVILGGSSDSALRFAPSLFSKPGLHFSTTDFISSISVSFTKAIILALCVRSKEAIMRLSIILSLLPGFTTSRDSFRLNQS
jgi:fluoride ion exporter CrcB/FEX